MNKLKKTTFGLLILLLLVPAIQQRFLFINLTPLNGSFKMNEIPHFSWSDWFSGNFQSSFDKGIEQNIGLRNSFVRLNNQINYSLFNFATAKDVVIGKNEFFYEECYITAHNGNDFAGENALKLKIEKLRFVQHELEKRGKHLLIIFAPSKAAYFPEYTPDRYQPKQKKITNYDFICKNIEKSGLHYIDFNGYFLKLKDSSPHPLYSKQGTHWSYYGASLAIDSTINYIKYNFNINIPQMKVKNIASVPSCWNSDTDIGDGMNLLFPTDELKLAYPEIVYEKDSSKTRPNVLTVGDSYYFTLARQGLNASAFNNDNFWFYNKIIYYDFGKERPVDNTKLEKELADQDIVILIQTEPSYNTIGFGFVEAAFDLFKNQQKLVKQ